MTVELSAFTNEGRVRTNNEDSWDIVAASWKAQNKTITVNGNGVLLAVADGMGGTNAGEVASRIAVETFRKEFEGLQMPVGDDNVRLQFLENLIKKAHKNIVEESTRNLDHAGMGTTAVLAWLLDDKAYVAWCGDSRLYLYRLGMPFTPFTDDHSIVWEQVKKGNMNAEQARLSDESNIILQSLGDVKQPPQPESRILSLQQNDRILLCSDGLNSMLSDGEIESLVATPNFDTTILCRQLVEAANTAGGRDNTTVIVANIVKGQKIASSSYPVSKKTSMSKLNLALLGLLLVLAAGIGYYFFVDNSESKTLVFSPTEISLISKLNLELKDFATKKEDFYKEKKDLSVCKLKESLQKMDTLISKFSHEIEKYGLSISEEKDSVLIGNSNVASRETFNSKSFDAVSSHLNNANLLLDNTIKDYELCAQPFQQKDDIKPNIIGNKSANNPKTTNTANQRYLKLAESMINQSNYLIYAEAHKDCKLLAENKGEFDKIKPSNIKRDELIKRHKISFDKNGNVSRVNTTDLKKLEIEANFISGLYHDIVKFKDKISNCSKPDLLTPIKNN